MKLLRKYTLNELIAPFFGSLIIFTFIFVVGNLVKLADLIINRGVNILDVLYIIVLLVPRLLSFTIPTSAITAILLVFGAMAQNNEIIAMKASGINVFRMLAHVILVSLVISVCSLFLNDQILPKTHFAYRKALKNVLVKKPLAYIQAGRFIKEFDDYIIFIREIEGNELKNITIYQPQEDKPTRTIIAEKGEIITDNVNKTLSLKLYNGTSDEPNPEDPSIFYKLDFKTFIMPPFVVDERKDIDKKTKDMSIDELYHKLNRNVKAESKLDQHEKEMLSRLKAEIHKKVAFSFAPFVFALVGIPLALITRRGDTVISFALALIVITVYYVLFGWASTVAIKGLVVPWLALWLPNIVLAVIGVIFMFKVNRT